jgi:hypothetical protein
VKPGGSRGWCANERHHLELRMRALLPARRLEHPPAALPLRVDGVAAGGDPVTGRAPKRYARAGARLCLDCLHLHGGLSFGLCFERLPNGELCPCHVARDIPKPVSARTLARRAARAFNEMSGEERAKYERVLARWEASDKDLLTIHELADESGLDERLLWRIHRSLRSGDQGRAP